MLLSVRDSEIEALLTFYRPRVQAIVNESAGGSARVLLDRITALMADLAADTLAREAPAIADLSKTKAKRHLRCAQLAVLELILPEKIPAGQEEQPQGILEDLPLGESWGLLRLPGYRRRVRAALLARLRKEADRMLRESPAKVFAADRV
jgi:hypothetical protein